MPVVRSALHTDWLWHGYPFFLFSLPTDEPTNSLDIETVDALVNALEDYNGGLVVVSRTFSPLTAFSRQFSSSIQLAGVRRYLHFFNGLVVVSRTFFLLLFSMADFPPLQRAGLRR